MWRQKLVDNIGTAIILTALGITQIVDSPGETDDEELADAMIALQRSSISVLCALHGMEIDDVERERIADDVMDIMDQICVLNPSERYCDVVDAERLCRA